MSDRQTSERLAALMKEVRRERERVARQPAVPVPPPDEGGVRRVAARWARRAALGVAALVLPFFLLLRSATWLYGTGRLGTWASLAVGAALTFLLLAGYALVVSRWVRRRLGLGDPGSTTPGATDRRAGIGARSVSSRGEPFPGTGRSVTKRLLQATAVLVIAYCGWGLVFLSGANAKSDAVRAEYRALHPHLRLAVATLVLVDSDLLVTDAARRLDDYAAMGLPPNERSLHLRQADGFAHALDLRTAGRPGWVNVLVRAWFRATGFRTLRHIGTADHLHVSLPLPPG